MKHHLIGAAAAALAALAPLQPAAAMEQRPTLSLDLAQKMAAGCLAEAGRKGWHMSVAVMDDGANPVLTERMDGAFLGSVDIARRKAETSARFPFPTRLVADLAYGKDGKAGPVPGLALVPGIVAFPGGLPVMTAGKAHIGGIGASGGMPDEDEACAKAGLAAVQDQLQ